MAWPNCSLSSQRLRSARSSPGQPGYDDGIGAAMTTQYYTGPNYGGRFFRFVLAMALGAAGFAIFVRHSTTGRAGRIVTLITGRGVSSDNSLPAVVEKMQRLGRPAVRRHLAGHGGCGRSLSSTPSGAPGGDRILLVVHGESVAGIDMAAAQAGGRAHRRQVPCAAFTSRFRQRNSSLPRWTTSARAFLCARPGWLSRRARPWGQ